MLSRAYDGFTQSEGLNEKTTEIYFLPNSLNGAFLLTRLMVQQRGKLQSVSWCIHQLRGEWYVARSNLLFVKLTTFDRALY